MKLDVLAIGAHPDDIELSCGGTVLKLSRQGKKVGIVDATEGELGTRGTREIRARESAAAAALLGVTVRENLSLPDGNIENTFASREKLITVIRRYRPDILLIPYFQDRHPDHEHTHALARESWFFAGLEKIVTADGGKAQEPWRPRAYYHYMQWFEFAPSFIIDVTDEYEGRIEAMRAYKSQFYDPASNERATILSTPDFLEMVTTRLAYYGDRIGRTYGEPFYSNVPLLVHDLVGLNV